MKQTLKKSAVAIRIALIGAVFFATSSLMASPVGTWATIGDKGENKGKVQSHILIYEYDGKLGGKVTKLITNPGAKCSADCPGKRANAPIEGMSIMWGFKKTGDNKWEGKIMDPEDGTIYSCIMTLKGNTLLVRGYVGISLLGRTQTWKKVN